MAMLRLTNENQSVIPTLQEQEADFAGDVERTGQAWQKLDWLVDANVPATQSIQEEDPEREYVPGKQSIQTDAPPDEYEPI